MLIVHGSTIARARTEADALVQEAVREAAAIDGASPWQILTTIDLPLMRPTIVVAFFVRFIDGFRVFDNVYTLTGSGAGGSTTSLSIYIYQAFFKQGDRFATQAVA